MTHGVEGAVCVAQTAEQREDERRRVDFGGQEQNTTLSVEAKVGFRSRQPSARFGMD